MQWFCSLQRARTLTASAAAVLTLLVASNASAKPEYLSILYDALDRNLEPQGRMLECRAQTCTNCHLKPEGGIPYTQPFLVMQYGLLARNDATQADMSIAKIQASQVDTDGDGVSDYEELIARTNPNVPGGDPAPCDGSGVLYGCGATIAPAPPAPLPRPSSLLALGAFAVGYVVRRRSVPTSSKR